MPIKAFKELKVMQQAAVGFLKNSELYTDEEIIAGYKEYISFNKKTMLSKLFKDDDVTMISCYANNGIITHRNFETNFLNPALKANATQCVAFLLNWKNENLSSSIDKFKL